MKLIVSPDAAEDLREIEAFIGDDNAKAAVEFVNRLTARFQDLAQFPGTGRRRDELKPGYRSVTEGEYLIFYQLYENAVEILHVIHG